MQTSAWVGEKTNETKLLIWLLVFLRNNGKVRVVVIMTCSLDWIDVMIIVFDYRHPSRLNSRLKIKKTGNFADFCILWESIQLLSSLKFGFIILPGFYKTAQHVAIPGNPASPLHEDIVDNND